MRILALTYAYAPDRAPRAYRWTALAEYLAGEGHHVDVVSGRKGGDAPFEVRNGVAVYRVGLSPLDVARSLVGQRAHGAAVGPALHGGGPARLLEALYGATWKRVYWPDYACLWYFPARIKALRLCRAEAYDAVVSVSHPFTGHLVGHWLKRAHPALRWIADVGDPFGLPGSVAQNSVFLYPALNRRAEARVLKDADAVTVTVDRCRTAYAEAFPGSAAKIRVIPPLLSLPSAKTEASRPLNRQAKHMVYVGTLYGGLRPPHFLLALFRALGERIGGLELHFFGDVNDCAPAFEPYAALLGRTLHVHGPVDRDEIARVIRAADVLVNIGNATAYQLPSKIVEYASTGKPILNLVSLDADCSMEFLRGYPAALSLVQSAAGPSEADVARLARFIAAPPSAISRDALKPFLEPYRVETVARAYLDLIAGGARAERPARRFALP